MKTTISIFALMACSLPVWAIVDDAENGNGMSDVWERHFNGDELFPSGDAPYGVDDDPDGDGQTNGSESVMGTDPFSAALPDGVVRATIINHPAGPTMFTIAWPSLVGKVYQFSCSTDLASWADCPDVMVGTGLAIVEGVECCFEDGTIPERQFWRVVVADFDSDGDGLSDWEEGQLGTEVNNPDTDGDGELDGPEVAAGTDPTIHSSEDDTDSDDVPNAVDAVYNDAEINWEKTPEYSYAVITVDDWDSTQGAPLAVNADGKVLFTEGLWNPATGDWENLPQSGSLDVTDDGQAATLSDALESYVDINDDGDVVGIGVDYGGLVYSSGMFWKLKNDGTYGTPDYFLKTTDIMSPEDGVWDIGGVSNRGLDGVPVVQCVTERFSLSLYQADGVGHVTDSVATESSIFTYTAGPALDAERGLGWRVTDMQSVPEAYERTLLIREYGNFSTGIEDVMLEDDPGMDMPDCGLSYTPTPKDNNDGEPITGVERLWIGVDGRTWAPEESRVFLEKRDHGLSGEDRWHKPPSMGEGAIRVNSRGEAITGGTFSKLWRNGEYVPLQDLVDSERWFSPKAVDLSESGIILATATEIIEGSSSVGRVVLMVPVDIVPDYNRDGRIDLADRGKVKEDNPWRWWINDDDDKTIAERGENEYDIPMQDPTVRDCNDLAVDGMRDLIDFFPLHLDLAEALRVLPEDKYKYVLKHEDEALKFYEYAACVIDGSDAGNYPNRHVKNVTVGKTHAAKALKLASATGTELGSGLLYQAKNGNGVIVVEGAKKTDKPLILEIIKKSDNTSMAEIEFPIRIVDVEDMYRHVNMRDVVGGTGGNATQTGVPPEYPENLTNDKFAAYIHGFFVSAEEARGSQSNIFKRLHHLGSNAQYIGITWYGNPPNPGMISVVPDYHRAADYGLRTGIVAKVRLGFTQDADFTVLAHSLGNSVMGSAIAHHGLDVDQYFIINGAIPVQAYDASQTDNSSGHPNMVDYMIEDSWKPFHAYGNNHELDYLYAANWHTFFAADPDDARNDLTWKNLFAEPELLGVAYNFYSPSDEVVENPDDTEEFSDIDNLYNSAINARHAWVNQEMAKGGASGLESAFFHDLNGGWDFNDVWKVPVGNNTYYRERTPAEAVGISKSLLKTQPFHKPFMYPNLYDSDLGSTTAASTTNRYKLLGTAIPAISYAIAPNECPKFDAENPGDDRNFNMPDELKNPDETNSWPPHPNALSNTDWMHSDFKDVALHHLHPMYQTMIDIGNLDQN